MYQLSRHFLLFGLAACASLLSVNAFAQGNLTPQQWLERMTKEGKKLNYEGAFTYQYGDQIISAKLYHTFKDGESKRRLVYLDGEQGEVLSQGNTVTYMKTSSQQGMSSSAPRAAVAAGFNGLGKRLNGLQTAYTLTMGKAARVAGRDAVVLKMQPRDPFRYEQKLFIDKQTGLLLKSETMGDDTRPLERFQFVQLKVGEPIKDEKFKPAKAWKKSFVRTQQLLGLQSEQPTLDWRLAWVPNGYTLVSSNKAKKNSSCLYSDGMSSFSVYLEPEVLQTAGGVMRKGASVVVSKVVELNGRKNTAIVVGDIPIATAERILQSVSVK